METACHVPDSSGSLWKWKKPFFFFKGDKGCNCLFPSF